MKGKQVTRFCKKYKMHGGAHRQLQEYLAQLEQLSDIVPKPDLFFKLSPALAYRTILQIHCVWITKLAFARSLMLRLGSQKPKESRGGFRDCRLRRVGGAHRRGGFPLRDLI